MRLSSEEAERLFKEAVAGYPNFKESPYWSLHMREAYRSGKAGENPAWLFERCVEVAYPQWQAEMEQRRLQAGDQEYNDILAADELMGG
jgi:hypothetical protein